MGGSKVTVMVTSVPVTGPSPPVNGFGPLIPFTTEFWTLKTGFTTAALALRLSSRLSRVASSISTSLGEFVRVGTAGVRACVRVNGENVIDLDFNPVDAFQRRSHRKQPREGLLIDDHALAENEVIGCLRLNKPGAGRT